MTVALPQIGDIVSYHLIPAHACDGVKCDCPRTQTKVFDAVVVARAIDADPEAHPAVLVLDVDLGQAEIALGYLRRQSHAPLDETADVPARSGHWRYRS